MATENNRDGVRGRPYFRLPTSDFRLSKGFTLIELIVALVILVIVLGMAYKILDNCLVTEKYIDEASRPEKVGQGILALIRKDLEGTIYRNLGTDRVFLVTGEGSGFNARSELRLYTTREPTSLEETGGGGAAGSQEVRTITAVSYFLREGKDGLFTLFRRENVATSAGDPFESGGGINYEVYDRVRSFSVLCFDADSSYDYGTDPWVDGWDSAQKLQLQAVEETDASLQQSKTGISPVSSPTKGATPAAGQPAEAAAGAGAGASAGSAPDAAAMEESTEVLPPAAIPAVVRVEISIYAGNEKGLFKNADGSPVIRTYATTVPLLASQRIPLNSEADLEAGAASDPKAAGIPKVGGSSATGGKSTLGSRK